jgi:NAD dependent epimerase/dehydratase family enzyme
MVVVAIVGGTGSVGHTLVDAFKENAKHDVIVLARKVSIYTCALCVHVQE